MVADQVHKFIIVAQYFPLVVFSYYKPEDCEL
jgi:hypothetical protein